MTKERAFVVPLAFAFFADAWPAVPAGSGVALKSRLRRYSSRAMAVLPQALLRFLAAFFAGLRAAGLRAGLAAVLRAGAFLAGFLAAPSSRLRFKRAMRSTTLPLGFSGLGAGAVEPSTSPASTRSSIRFIRPSRSS